MQPQHHKPPVFLNLFKFHFPLNAVLSILHRISGVFLVFGFILLLVWLNKVAFHPEYFAENMAFWSHPLSKLGWMLFAFSLWFHWLSGARHLLMEHDFQGWLSNIHKARRSAMVLIWMFVLGCVIIAYLVWL